MATTCLPRLLLVEDDPVSREFLAAALAALPAEVCVRLDAHETLRMTPAPAFDLWLFDGRLPDASGEQLLARMCALVVAPPPALCLTADARSARHRDLIAAGFAEVVVKPVSSVDLLAAVRRHLGPRRNIDPVRAARVADGDPGVVQALHAMFVAELPGERERVRNALAERDDEALRAVLHRLKASCAFVGAVTLAHAVGLLAAKPHDLRSRDAFERACRLVLGGH